MRLAVSVFLAGCLLLPGQSWAQAVPDAAQPAPVVKPKPRPAPAPVPGATAAPAAVPGAAPATPPKPKPPAPTAKLLDKHADWTSYIHDARGAKVCFTAATPKETLPKGVKRANVYFYLTTWQKDRVQGEASISFGYQVKPDVPVKVIVDGAEFAFFARGDKAYIQNPNEERQLLKALSTGQSLSVQAVSAKGTQTTDEYSLAGLDAAVRKIGEVCQ